MINKIFKSVILLICTVLLISCNVNNKSNSLNIKAEDESVIREYLDNNTGNNIVNSDEETYSVFKVLGTGTDKIYLWVLKENKSGAGASMPVLLKANRDNDVLNITSYKIPRDGSLYSKDIKNMFPKSVQKHEIFIDTNKHNAMIQDLEKQLNEIKITNPTN